MKETTNDIAISCKLKIGIRDAARMEVEGLLVI